MLELTREQRREVQLHEVDESLYECEEMDQPKHEHSSSVIDFNGQSGSMVNVVANEN